MYNALIDLAVFGVILSGLGLTLWWFDRKPKRGATKAEQYEIKAHQDIRRLENGLQRRR